MPEEKITRENVFEVDIRKLALDDRFGALKFGYALDNLLKIQRWLKEAQDLNYQELLIGEDINIIEELINELVVDLEYIERFDIRESSNPTQEQDVFNHQTNDFYQKVYTEVVMRILLFLRDEKRREDPEQQKLDVEIAKVSEIRSGLEKEVKKIEDEVAKLQNDKSELNNALQEAQSEIKQGATTRSQLEDILKKAKEDTDRNANIRSELELRLKEVKEDIKQIRGAKRNVSSAQGQRATANLSSHFDKESKHYEEIAKQWNFRITKGYFIVAIISVIFGVYIFVDPDIAWQQIVAKSAVLLVLWSGLYFCIRNYNINSHLCSVNRHRAAVAKTLDDFIAFEQQEEYPQLSEVLQNATDAMFKNVSIGYVSKPEQDTGSPILKIISDLIGGNKDKLI